MVGQAGDAEDLLRKVRAHKPDVAITDIRMPPSHTDEGLRAAHEIRGELPEIGVLVLSQYVEEGYALDLLADNAAGLGYLLKDRVGDVDAFLDAVRRVSEGGSALDPEVVSQLMGRKRRDDPLDELTPREREVLGLMAEGRSNRAIAEALVVTERAVEKHVTSIFSKLDLVNTPEDHRRCSPCLHTCAHERAHRLREAHLHHVSQPRHVPRGARDRLRTRELPRRPLPEDKIRDLVRKTGGPAADLLRKREPAYKEHVEGRDLSDDEIIRLMAEHPPLLQRPVVERGDRAVLARPVERVAELL